MLRMAAFFLINRQILKLSKFREKVYHFKFIKWPLYDIPIQKWHVLYLANKP